MSGFWSDAGSALHGALLWKPCSRPRELSLLSKLLDEALCRYPAHWAAREAEERELARLSRAEADARQRERLRERLTSSRNPFERWLGSL